MGGGLPRDHLPVGSNPPLQFVEKIPAVLSGPGLVYSYWSLPAVRLLNQRRRGDRRSLLSLFSVILPFLVGRALSRGNLVQCAPLGFHPHVGVARDMARETRPMVLPKIVHGCKSISPPRTRRR